MNHLFPTSVLVVACILVQKTHAQANDSEKPKIAVIHKGSYLDFWQQMHEGVKQAALDFDINVKWQGAFFSDHTNSQVKLVNRYVDEKVDAIVLIPTNRDALVAPVKRATAHGVKVIVIDSGLAGNHHLSFIGSDNFRGGQLAARKFAEGLNKKGKVVVLRTVKGSASTDKRADGFISEIKQSFPNIQVVADIYGGTHEGATYRTTKKLLKEKSFDAVFCVNEAATSGAVKAILEAGLEGKIKIGGYDSNPLLMENLQRKVLSFLVIQDPYKMGYEGVKAALRAISNKKVKPVIHTEVNVISG